ncbi:hypothetical protein [Thermostaphylospora chromogena]|uniref:Uncharacterized protein n=1 Tax=Thermostaphylospora chromogena TaxID=35622 RepID=A0A1H1EX83_9ACTN|nr:hypothetical protein [Thermostaphylospora chromogena]SDQ93159.1 hypothetical protein SAMN04489764_2667 [Thermostaphylospora chromogena]
MSSPSSGRRRGRTAWTAIGVGSAAGGVTATEGYPHHLDASLRIIPACTGMIPASR